MNPRRLLKLFLFFLAASVLLGYMIPRHFIMPVAGAGKNSYNKSSFWFYLWGKSVTHKGVDNFAPEGTRVISSTGGIVLFSGVLERGGNAKGKPDYLHYSISSLLPIPWRADDSKQGWKKIFYPDPTQYQEQANERFHSK